MKEVKGEDIHYIKKELGQLTIFYADGQIEIVKPDIFSTQEQYLMLKLNYYGNSNKE